MFVSDSLWRVMNGLAEVKATLVFALTPLALGVGYYVLPAGVHDVLYSKLALVCITFAWLVTTKTIAGGGLNVYNGSLRGKTVIVTGGATGIGLETVRTFAKMGATVILAARGGPTRLAQAVEAAKVGVRGNQAGTIIGMELDLSSFASIHTFVQEFLAEHTQLHLLVNNAGVMMCPYSLTADGLEMQIGTNHFGHFLLTSLLIDTLAASKARVVTVSSLGHALVERLTYPKQNDPKKYDKMVAYSDSKLANIYFTQELARRYADKGIEAVAVHPGCVDTPLARHLSSVLQLLGRPISLMTLKTPLQGAQTTLFACLCPTVVSGRYYADCQEWPISDAAADQEKAKWLWEESERVTKIN